MRDHAQHAAAWQQHSMQCFRAAANLQKAGLDRSVVNRAYYAAYAAITSKLPAGTKFPRGMRNPGHEQLRELVYSKFKLEFSTRKSVLKRINFLWQWRVTADYRPLKTVEATVPLECIHSAAYICRIFGVNL